MKHSSYIIIFFIGLLISKFSYGQQTTLIGHQDLIGYYNPALISGTNGQISYLYRYQWEGLGPSSNTLYFKYPLMRSNKFYKPHAIGTTFQYEDFNLLDRAHLEFFMSNTLAELNNVRIGLGLNAGISYSGIDTDDFNVEEVIDPELGLLDRRLSVTNKAGVSFHHRLVDVGFAARFINVQIVSDYHSSYSFKIPLRNPKFRLNPIVILRMTESFESQMEGQLRSTYDNKVSLTAGYRQNFGAIFQIAFKIDNVGRVSYGIETPNGDAQSLGLTHELFGSYYFESPALVQHRKDSIIKVRRDSVNRARVEKYRKQREEEIARKDSIALIKEAENPIVVNTDTLKQKTDQEEKLEEKGIYSSLDDLPGNVSDNTHIILDHIGFEPGLYLLTPESYKELERLFHYIRHHKSLHIEIQGHTDNSGSPENNVSLSRYRALAVYNYLVSRGVDTARMNVVGYGENQPLYPNDTPENRELNRRIEIVFIKKD